MTKIMKKRGLQTKRRKGTPVPIPSGMVGNVKRLSIHIEGTQPQLQHNGSMADPLHPLAEEIRQTIELTKKAKGKDIKKFKQLVEHKLQLQALGSLYLDADRRPCWPGENIERMLARAAVLKARGLQGYVKAGVLCPGSWPIIYSGPKDPEKLVKDKKFRFDVIVNGNPTSGKGGGRVTSARPIFRKWALDFDLVISEDGDNITVDGILDLVQRAGIYVGLSDWPERFGRFKVVSAEVNEE